MRTSSHKFTVREAVKFALALTPTPQTNQPPTHRHIPLRANLALPSLRPCLPHPTRCLLQTSRCSVICTTFLFRALTSAPLMLLFNTTCLFYYQTQRHPSIYSFNKLLLLKFKTFHPPPPNTSTTEQTNFYIIKNFVSSDLIKIYRI